MVLSPISQAAIINNNHLFQKTQVIAQQLAAIRSQQSLSELSTEPQIYADKLAIHLVFKSQQLSELAAKLQQQHGLSPSAPISVAYSVIRPRSVMPFLELLEQQLVAVVDKVGATKPKEVERPLGKSVNDVYQQLVIIEALFVDLVDRQGYSALANNLAIIKGDLQQISQLKELPLSFAPLENY